MLLVAVLGVAVICYMETNPVQDIAEIGFRMAWLVLTGGALTAIYCVYHNKNELNVVRTIFIMLLIIAQIALYHGLDMMRAILPGDITHGQLLLVLPYALAPSITAVLLGRKLGVYVALCTSLFGLAIMPLECPVVIIVDYLVISLLAGVLGALLCHRVSKRESILYAGFIVGLSVLASLIVLGCFKENGLAALRGSFNLSWLATETVAAVGSSFFCAVIVSGLMPMFEKLFNISTHISWLEWADMNHPLLKEMLMRAPGTFHHSLCVQRLAEAAARAIGADVTRAGVCALYHDIGKLKKPEYFTENNLDKENSPHNGLTPEMSARILIQHVEDGVELAREYKLNPRIIAVIREHHGVGSPGKFLEMAQLKYEENMAKFNEGLIDTRPEEVRASNFSYKGPVPQTRESGIVSMADVVESASRSLKEHTEECYRENIDKWINKQLIDGHLRDSQLTLGDIAKIKEAFVANLMAMKHNRIAYSDPKAEREEARESASANTPSPAQVMESSAKAAS